MTQSERHKWEEKRERMPEELKNRRPREEFKKEDWPEELKEGTKRLRDESKQDRLMSTQPGERAPGDPQREKHADLHKLSFER